MPEVDLQIAAQLQKQADRIEELQAENAELRKAHNTPYSAYLDIRKKQAELLEALKGLPRYAVNPKIHQPDEHPLYLEPTGSWVPLGNIQALLDRFRRK